MEAYVETLKKQTKTQHDLRIDQLQVGSITLWIAGYESLVSWEETISFISNCGIGADSGFEEICARLLGQAWTPATMDLLLQGKVVLIDATANRAFSFQGKLKQLDRAIDKAENEFLPFSSAIAFMEPLTTNMGILRRTIDSTELQIEILHFHGVAQKQAALVYLSEDVDRDLLETVKNALKKASKQDVRNGQDLIRIFGQSRYHLLSPYHKTELPGQAVASMMQGRVLLLIDGEPTAYVLPLIFSDFIALEWDRQFPIPIMLLLRGLRLLSILVALLIPGLYVALVSVNPETLRIELALSIAESRIGIPLPTFLEMLLLLIISEIIIEATQRLPKTIASTNCLIGGIILGQAIVDAKLVSNLVIIVLAASVTAHFAFPNYLNTLIVRMLRSGVVILSGVFGIFGLFVAFIAICYYACSLQRFGVPFMDFLSAKEARTMTLRKKCRN
ncbi:spore germination protein [Paenibacillus lignilyticus]|uniref:Spore germination protein n=1 Tax=Paenibacillus lignilyticus TaxID=1172615 RepID=A0ABS5CKL9_9BACL|nr:spore germination protein [Paenibacillus lignilyticus]MBP3966367.1 spore germination protein [Paenibacillus lignilyticus]